MKCVKDCYFLRNFHIYYCDLYDKILQTEGEDIIRCEECERGETLYYTRIKEYAKERMDNDKKIKR